MIVFYFVLKKRITKLTIFAPVSTISATTEIAIKWLPSHFQTKKKVVVTSFHSDRDGTVKYSSKKQRGGAFLWRNKTHHCVPISIHYRNVWKWRFSGCGWNFQQLKRCMTMLSWWAGLSIKKFILKSTLYLRKKTETAAPFCVHFIMIENDENGHKLGSGWNFFHLKQLLHMLGWWPWW